jgi:hypothetical protein
LSLGATPLFAAGLLMAHGLLLRDATPGVLLFSLGAILVAIRG